MAFTAAELDNIANAALDFYLKKQPVAQTIQDKPLLTAMRKTQKTFPGGKGKIDGPVKGVFETYMAGYTHNDSVSYKNPASTKRWNFSWKELSGGLALTMTELKMDGISVVDTDGKQTTTHTEAEKTRLFSLLEDKMDDMKEGTDRDMNAYFWGDGVADAKGPAGVLALLTLTPATGLTGGIDRALNAWWRHRAFVGTGTNATGAKLDTATVQLPLFLKKEWRQLTRYAGNPRLWLAGSAFIESLESQLYAKGAFSQTGFSVNGKNDIGIADITFNGIKIQYDPWLDDNGKTKFLYAIDQKHLYPYVMEGEDMKKHTPSRPADKYVVYKAVTWTGNMVCDQLNCHGVYEIA